MVATATNFYEIKKFQCPSDRELPGDYFGQWNLFKSSFLAWAMDDQSKNARFVFVGCSSPWPGMSLKYPNLQTLNTLLLSILLNPFPRCVISARRNETVCTQTIPGKIRQIATLARLISVIIYPELSIGNYCVFYRQFATHRTENRDRNGPVSPSQCRV